MPSEGAQRSCYLNHFDSTQKMEQKFSCRASLFSAGFHPPAERQVGFWEHETATGQHGIADIPLFQGNNAVLSASFGSFGLSGVHSLDCLQQSEHHIKEFMVNPVLEKNAIGSERSAVLSTGSLRTVERRIGVRESISAKPATLYMAGNKTDMSRPQHENGFFSSSLSEALEKKCHSVDTAIFCFDGDEAFESLEEIEAQTIGDLLPDDDELFSGVVDENDYIAQINNSDEMEDFDLFSSVGGMELEDAELWP